MAAEVDPIPLVLAFLGSSIPTMGTGAFLVSLGFKGLKRGSYPFSASMDITGLPARLVACFVILFGVIVCICGIATLIFCCWRLYDLLS